MNDLKSPIGKLRGKSFIPGIAWFFLVLLLICLPGQKLPQVNDWLSIIYFDKWVHTGLFAVLAYLFMRPFLKSSIPGYKKWQYLVKITIATCIWGITTELIQNFFVSGRSFDLFDWGADSLGALLALVYSKIRFVK